MCLCSQGFLVPAWLLLEQLVWPLVFRSVHTSLISSISSVVQYSARLAYCSIIQMLLIMLSLKFLLIFLLGVFFQRKWQQFEGWRNQSHCRDFYQTTKPFECSVSSHISNAKTRLYWTMQKTLCGDHMCVCFFVGWDETAQPWMQSTVLLKRCLHVWTSNMFMQSKTTHTCTRSVG